MVAGMSGCAMDVGDALHQQPAAIAHPASQV
jgi:hypothetical protein